MFHIAYERIMRYMALNDSELCDGKYGYYEVCDIEYNDSEVCDGKYGYTEVCSERMQILIYLIHDIN